MKIYKRCEENWKPIPGINYQNLFYPLSFCYNKMKMLDNKEPLGRVTGSKTSYWNEHKWLCNLSSAISIFKVISTFTYCIYIKDLCSSVGGGGGIQQDGWITERPTLLCGPGERFPQTDEPQDRGLHSRKGKAKNTLKICEDQAIWYR